MSWADEEPNTLRGLDSDEAVSAFVLRVRKRWQGGMQRAAHEAVEGECVGWLRNRQRHRLLPRERKLLEVRPDHNIPQQKSAETFGEKRALLVLPQD